MNKIDFNKMAADLRKEGYNFVLVLERGNETYSHSSIEGASKLQELEKEAFRVCRVGRYDIPGQVEIK